MLGSAVAAGRLTLDYAYGLTDATADLTGLGVDSGPCGAAALAALRTAAADDDGQRTLLGLGPDSVVVLLSTEGSAANPKGAR
ncbi:hypothetical protein [Nocardiopsis potens]|uniref:hypothetical protein n=1 Tax=Nocardiopsis potens TaxID=1246458 RepID=UPI0003758526|nr:hypothetical protein [Nocardiopsis potens]